MVLTNLIEMRIKLQNNKKKGYKLEKGLYFICSFLLIDIVEIEKCAEYYK